MPRLYFKMDPETLDKLLDENTPFIKNKTIELSIKELKADIRHLLIPILSRKSEALAELERWYICYFISLSQEERLMKWKNFEKQQGNVN